MTTSFKPSIILCLTKHLLSIHNCLELTKINIIHWVLVESLFLSFSNDRNIWDFLRLGTWGIVKTVLRQSSTLELHIGKAYNIAMKVKTMLAFFSNRSPKHTIPHMVVGFSEHDAEYSVWKFFQEEISQKKFVDMCLDDQLLLVSPNLLHSGSEVGIILLLPGGQTFPSSQPSLFCDCIPVFSKHISWSKITNKPTKRSAHLNKNFHF